MRIIILEPVEFTVRKREAHLFGVDLFWKGTGWFHVWRDGCKIGVTCSNRLWSEELPVDGFVVYREISSRLDG
jgi:hypothetical protein